MAKDQEPGTSVAPPAGPLDSAPSHRRPPSARRVAGQVASIGASESPAIAGGKAESSLVVAATLLMAGAATGTAGHLVATHADVVIMAAGVYVAALIARRSWPAPATGLAASAVAAVAAVVVLLVAGTMGPMEATRLEFVGLAMFLAAWAAADARGLSFPRSLQASLALFAALASLYFEAFINPDGPGRPWRLALSQRASEVISGDLRLNPTPSGLDLALMGMLLAGTLAWRAGRGRWLKLLGTWGFLVAAQAIALWACGQAPASWWAMPSAPSEVDIESSVIREPIRIFTMYDAPTVLALIAGAIVSLALGRRGPEAAPARGRALPAALAAAAGLALAWGIGRAEPPVGEADLQGIRLGVYCPWDTMAPDFTGRPYGIGNTGMYGTFLRDLEHRGARVVSLAGAPGTPIPWAPTVDPSGTPAPGAFAFREARTDLRDLKDLDCVVIVVRTKAFADAELAELRRFMDGGGAVFLVGDHTNLEGCQAPFNELGQPLGIRLAFDSAFSHSKWWYRNLVASPRLGFAPGCWLDFGVGTGGSLALDGGARPLLVAPYAFSDLGNLLKSSQKEAYLGDYAYQHGELLGDITLAASARSGRGHLVAIGDSSLLQNIFYSRSGRYVRHLLAAFGREGLASSGRSGVVAIAGVLGVAVVALLPAALSLPAAIACALAGVAIGWASGHRGDRSPGPTLAGDGYQVVDANLSAINRDPFSPHGCSGLPINLVRSGPSCDFAYSIEAAASASPKGIFLIGPQRGLSLRESDALDRYMKGGGTVFLAAGRDASPAVAPWLRGHGLEILDVPLGGDPFAGRMPGKATTLDAWELRASGPGAVVILERLGRPAIAFQPVGRGGLLLVGDTHFFSDMNLESEKTSRPPNIIFLKGLLAMLPTRPANLTPDFLGTTPQP